MKKMLLIIVAALVFNVANAQFIKEKAINAQIGFGYSTPNNSEDNVVADGFYTQGEFIMKISSWLDARPYVGFITTTSDGKNLNDDPTDEKAELTAFFLGGKARVRAPIPYVAPYIEVGVGASIGKFETMTVFDMYENSGILYHIPFALGLELGKEHNIDLGLSYQFHPIAKQFSGAVAVGITFPLND